LKWEDIGALFSCYVLVDYKDNLRKSLKNRILAIQKEKAKTKVYEVRVNPETGKKVLKRRPKDEKTL
jgi:hypothetical protein